ncbi:DNA polymerase alpha catalytic subunit [Phymastichus coffea]|uniref:DNA polymerase alpha catalytic subunit n=1 Tax=Phymastichus coffea TaxID=108790 RepID=UPI00273C6D38|nr:DNA polymerase alpha catalytic subunit [Phymastichus coffea]
MDESLSTHRSKRQKVDKTGRLSALERFKQLKGSKNKYEVNDIDNIYDEVEESEYSKTVLKRQCDDWIVDDGGGSGYVEDGREIFDDDLDDESVQKASKNHDHTKGPRKRKREADTKKPSSSITSMFSSMANKKKASDRITDENDDFLGDLMLELDRDKKGSENEKQTPRFNKFAVKKPPTEIDDNKLFANMIKETAKPKQKTLLDDLDDQILYDKPDRTPKPKIKHTEILDSPLNKDEINRLKPKIKHIEILDSPLNKDEINVLKTTKISEPTDSIMEAESLDFDDDFGADDFSTAASSICTSTSTVKNSKSLFNSTASSVRQSMNSADITSESTNGEDLNQYIGDISDIDFGNTEMDTSVTQPVNTSQMWKEKDADKHDENIFAKIWEVEFTQVSKLISSKISVTEDKPLPLPTITNEAGEKIFRFFWWDAFEDAYKQPGVVYLFGKVFVKSLNEYVSCSLAVKNIPRRIYLLPRETARKIEDDDYDDEINFGDIHTEFNEHLKALRIDEFRYRNVKKKYAFDRPETPFETEYLEVRYPAKYPPIDPNYSSKLIEAVFGTSVNALELLLIERNIKGPCWLDVKAAVPASNPYSWCKVQANCLKLELVTVTPQQLSLIPPVSIATLNIQVSLDPKQQKNEIANIGMLLHHKFQLDKAPPKPPFETHYCLVTHPKCTGWPMKARDHLAKIQQTKVIVCETELELLERFLEILRTSNPDIIVGYDIGFQFEVLMSKIYELKVRNWSVVGKLRRAAPTYNKGKMMFGQIFCGRPICDITNSAKELNLKVRSYDLTSLCVAVLNKKEYECKEIKPEDCSKFYISTEKLENLIQTTMVEASYILSIVIELNILPLALQITNIAGNTLSRTLSAGRAERNEFLLLHAFYNKGYITPDKRSMKKKDDNEAKANKKKPQYAGGLVLEPKKGLYDTLILLMDFNSLYPSIIQEFNLCFTTVSGAAFAPLEDLALPESSVDAGIIPTEIRKLVQSRVEVKKLMKAPNLTPELKMQYNIRQLALKLTANSMYGCLGATHCRFYAKGLAALVTMKGREILQSTKSLVEKANYDVIYGDTDSIMINTNIVEYDQVFNIGKEIKKEVNKMYKKVELDIDGVFKKLLLLQKKKYAVLTMTKLPNGQIQTNKELKGLDIVRRDWCGLACDIGNQVIDQLLSDESSETRINNIFETLQNIGNSLREGKLPLSCLVITKQLSKNPNEYGGDKKQSHVTVALRLNESGGRKWKAGDTVPYIICLDNTDKSAHERAYHIEEFKKSNKLKVDVNYYLLNQIHPVIMRICEPIEGIDDVVLAQCLGVADLYKPRKVYSNQEAGEVPLCVQDNRFDKCHPFRFTCRNESCKTEMEIKTVLTEIDGVVRPSLEMCSNPECHMAPWKYAFAIQNKVQLDIRKFISEYYYGEAECENPACLNTMRRITLDTAGSYPKCYHCLDGNVHRIHKETELYNQLSFYLHLFTLDQAHLKSLKPTPQRELIFVYDHLKEFIEKQIQCNAYSVVDLTKLFWPNLQESDIDALTVVEEVPLTVENFIEDDEDIEENDEE